MHDKVFISYAKEDYKFANELYDFLKENGFKPWLDKKELLPGQDWNHTIRKALREANYIILLLSNISVQKRGYVQREFKTALDFVDEKLEDDIYLIPLKINDCQAPEKLSKFQWIEYDSDSCFIKILQSLNLQRGKYIDYERKQIAAKELFAYKEYEENFEYGESVKFSIETKYFQFKDETNPNLKELNAIIKGKQAEYIVDSRKEFYDISGNLITLKFKSLNWFFDISFSPNLITKSIISISEDIYRFAGGAHGNGHVDGLNYHINPIFRITLQELFEYDDYKTVLQFLSNYCFEELRKRYNEALEPSKEEVAEQRPDTLFWEGSLDPKWENFDTFFISKNGLQIFFNSYTVSAYAFGQHNILIPYEKLLAILTKPNRLKDLINKL